MESSIIAWSLWLLRDTLLPQMSSLERQRIDAWLASCTTVPVRKNNWAWFTAVNHAARTALKDRFDEFSYDRSAMFDDLRALDGMYVGGGWYNDDKPHYAFDYYNSWVFASHYLYWNAMVGSKFPEWSRIFGERLKVYLGTAPLFFGSNGSHILYGRSLIYRWAVLTPLVLAYVQKQWPHDPAMLHRIVRGNLEYHWNNGAFESEKGKLRETYSDKGTGDIGSRTSMAGTLIGGCRPSLMANPARRPVLECFRRSAPGGEIRLRSESGNAGDGTDGREIVRPGQAPARAFLQGRLALSRQVQQARILVAFSDEHRPESRMSVPGTMCWFCATGVPGNRWGAANWSRDRLCRTVSRQRIRLRSEE